MAAPSPRPRRFGWKGLLLAGALLVLAGAGAWVIRTWRQVTSLVPRPPAANLLRPELADEIAAQEKVARSLAHPLDGVAALSRLYHANGFYDEAIRCYELLEHHQPREARWRHLHASILAMFGRTNEAADLARTAALIAPDYLPAQIRLGDILTKANRPGEAAEAYTAVLAREPHHAYALLGLARLDVARQEWAAAQSRLQEAVTAHPDCIGALALLVTVYERTGRQEEARVLQASIAGREHRDIVDPWLDELTEQCYDPYRLSVAAALANIAGDGATARRWLERAVALSPDTASYRRLLAQLVFQQQDFAAAREQLEKAVALAPGDADAWRLLVETLTAMGAPAEAERALRNGLAACPQSGSLHYEFGRRLAAAGRHDQAIVELKLAKQYRPSEVNPYIDLAQVYFRLQRIDEGLAEMRGALAVQPGNPLALQVLARDAIMRGDEPAARQRIQELRQLARMPAADLDVILGEFRQRFGHAP